MVKRKSKQPEPEPEEDSNEFQVQEILGSKHVNDRTYYLIQWVGYERKDCTWENSTHVFCDELIQRFNKDLDKNNSTDKEKKALEVEFPFPEEYNDPNYQSDDEAEEEEVKPETKKKQKKSSKSTKKSTPNTKKKQTSTTSKTLTKSSSKSTPVKEEKSKAKRNSTSHLNEVHAGFEYGDKVETILGCKMLDQLSFYPNIMYTLINNNNNNNTKAKQNNNNQAQQVN
ncbi:chromo domain-containing protein [Heterostelium album PN500]|uniref:Chromo domain-containing protein n=1 Tax=Heterostelium pallidum (strain ATCC 26659 / Pp 5 / PN500) TaxID=670386 RepID=D3BKN9_HETP5|nr:chromo domain-containing protein [Heterostelium album PN500]EFA78469.1 chromo domain-containing protein [Heterostelium album PN500]|eukprot:XP_020430593.1 chromo domain-containing protein [Heterostelium album PN500]